MLILCVIGLRLGLVLRPSGNTESPRSVLKLVAMVTSLERSEKGRINNPRPYLPYGDDLLKVGQVDPQIICLKLKGSMASYSFANGNDQFSTPVNSIPLTDRQKFCIYNSLFGNSPTGQIGRRIFALDDLNDSRKDVPFGV